MSKGAKLYTAEELEDSFIAGQHTQCPHTTAPDTDRRLQNLELALFGNKNQIGMQTMVKEMHAFFKGANFTRKFILGFFIVMGTVAGSIMACIHLIRTFKN